MPKSRRSRRQVRGDTSGVQRVKLRQPSIRCGICWPGAPLWGGPGAQASKLLAPKRPRLIPVTDEIFVAKAGAGLGASLPAASQNPVRYFEDAEADGAGSPCRCGCGDVTRGTWVQGHDHRAIHQRIGQDFAADVARFIDWYDSAPAEATRPTD